MGRRGRPSNQEKKNKKPSDIEKKNGSFKRWKGGIMKKAEELSILCDIPVVVMVRCPSGKLEIWPKDPCQVRNVLEKYEKKNPRQNPEETEVKEPDLTAGLLPADQERLPPAGENMCVAGRVQSGFEPTMSLRIPKNEGDEFAFGAQAFLQNYSTNAAINDQSDSFFDWKQSLAPLEVNFDDLQPGPSQICYPNMDIALHPYIGSILQGGNSDLGLDDPHRGPGGGYLDSGFGPDFGCNPNDIPWSTKWGG